MLKSSKINVCFLFCYHTNISTGSYAKDMANIRLFFLNNVQFKAQLLKLEQSLSKHSQNRFNSPLLMPIFLGHPDKHFKVLSSFFYQWAKEKGAPFPNKKDDNHHIPGAGVLQLSGFLKSDEGRQLMPTVSSLIAMRERRRLSGKSIALINDKDTSDSYLMNSI